MASYEDQLELEELIGQANARMDPRGLSDRFMKSLNDRLAKKRKKEDPLATVQPETTRAKTDDDSFDASLFANAEPEKSTGQSLWEGADKVIDFLNEPLSDGYFGKLQRERAKEWDNAPEGIQHTGGQNKLQDFAATISAMGRGFKRGVFEGAGDAADSLTAPSTWLSIGGAGAAGKVARTAPKAAKVISNLVRGVEATQIPHGIEQMVKADTGTTEGKLQALFGGIEAAGGGVGAFTPAARTRPTAAEQAQMGADIPNLDEPIVTSETVPQGQRQLPPYTPQLTGRSGPGRPPPKPAPPPPPRSVKELPPSSLADEIVNEPVDDFDASLFSDGRPVVDDVAPKRVDDIDAPWDDVIDNTSQAPNDIVARLFPEMANRTPKRTLTTDEGPSFVERARKFMSDDKGEIDFSKFFQGEDDLGYNVRTNDPDAVDLGDFNPNEIDLNAEALAAASDTAKPVSRLQRLMGDEQGAVGSRAYAMKKTYDSLVAENAPDSAFSRVASGAKPMPGQTYKQLAEDYIKAYETMEANSAKPASKPKGARERAIKAVDPNGEVTPMTVTKAEIAEVRKDPQYADLTDDQIADAILEIKREDAGATQATTQDMLEQKAATPKLTKSGKVVKEAPLSENAIVNRPAETEDEAIARLQREVGINAQREADAARAAGEVEADPDQIRSIFQRRQEELSMPPEVFDPAPRDGTPLLRAKALKDLSFPPKGRLKTAANKAKVGLGTFLRNEKGEINFEGMFKPDTVKFDESIPQLGPDATSPRFEDRGTRGYDEARLSELFDKNIAGTLTGDELAEGKTLFSRMRDFWADERGEIDFSALLDEAPASGKRSVFDEQAHLGFDDLEDGVPVDFRKPPTLDEPSMARKIWDSTMGIPATDMPFLTSAAFRQASPLAWTKNWYKAWGDAARSFGSKQAYENLMSAIENSEGFKPRFKEKLNSKGEVTGYTEMPSIAEEAGVRMSDFSRLSDREEALRGSLVEKIPGIGRYVKASNRAYTGFLNSIRANKFNEMLEQANWSGQANNKKLLKDIGEFINVATGRASLKGKIAGSKYIGGEGTWDLDKVASEIATILWSPRLLMSRFKLMNITNYGNLEPQVRKEYIKALGRSAGTWMGFAGLASMIPGVSVSMDMNDSDFGKIKIGDNTRIDPGSGFQQLLVFANRMNPELTGGTYQAEGPQGGPFERTRRSTAERFLANKMHPSARLAYDLLTVTEDKPVHLADRAVQSVLPMMAQDILDVMKENKQLGAAIGPLSSIGLGTQHYTGSDFNDPVFTDDIENLLGKEPGSLAGTITKW